MEIAKEPAYVVFGVIDYDDMECAQKFPKTEDGLAGAKALYNKIVGEIKEGKSEYTSVSVCPLENGCYRFDKTIAEYELGKEYEAER